MGVGAILDTTDFGSVSIGDYSHFTVGVLYDILAVNVRWARIPSFFVCRFYYFDDIGRDV